MITNIGVVFPASLRQDGIRTLSKTEKKILFLLYVADLLQLVKRHQWIYTNYSLMFTQTIHRFTGSANRLRSMISKHALWIVLKMSQYGRWPIVYSWIQRRRKFSGVYLNSTSTSALYNTTSTWKCIDILSDDSARPGFPHQLRRHADWPLTLQQLSDHVSQF